MPVAVMASAAAAVNAAARS